MRVRRTKNQKVKKVAILNRIGMEGPAVESQEAGPSASVALGVRMTTPFWDAYLKNWIFS